MSWKMLATAARVAAQPIGIWTLVLDYVEAPAVLKIVAGEQAAWRYTPGITCGADGDPTSMIARSRCIHAAGPVGALIGKMGGSTAGTDDGKVFLVGRCCIIGIEEKGAGPLFLTINDEVAGFGNNSGEIDIDVMRRIEAP